MRHSNVVTGFYANYKKARELGSFKEISINSQSLSQLFGQPGFKCKIQRLAWIKIRVYAFIRNFVVMFFTETQINSQKMSGITLPINRSVKKKDQCAIPHYPFRWFFPLISNYIKQSSLRH